MRKELFYNPRLLLERIAQASFRKRRLDKLKKTIANDLKPVHITSLEFLEICNNYFKFPIIYDIGANEGKWAKLAKAICPNSKVYSFEPTPFFQDEFLKNNSSIEDIVLKKVAIGSTNEIKKFNFAGHSSSFLEIGPTIIANYNTPKEYEIDVNLVRLDDFIVSENLPKPNIIKFDIEGYEIEAFKGALETLKTTGFLIVEVSFEERHIGQPLFPEVVKFLSDLDFNIYAFPLEMHLGTKIIMTDVLFYNTKIIKPL